MSKSLGNYVGITDEPNDMFGKLMSISDELMWRYFDLLSFRGVDEIFSLKNSVLDGENPRNIKVSLALEIVERFHSKLAAENAKDAFESRFQRGEIPADIAEVSVPKGPLANVLKNSGLTTSTSEALRLIDSGAVKVNGQRVADRSIELAVGEPAVIQVGKRKFMRVTVLS